MGSRNLIISCIIALVLAGIILAMPSSDADGIDAFGISEVCFDADSCICTVSGNSPDEIVHLGLFSGETKLVEAYASTINGAFFQEISTKDLPATGLSVKIWNYSSTAVDSENMVTIDSADYSRNSKILSVSGYTGDEIVHLGIFDSKGVKVHEFYAVPSNGVFSVDVILDGIAYGDYVVKAWNGNASVIAQKIFKLECPQYTVVFKDYNGTVLSEKVYDLGTKASVILPENPIRVGEYHCYEFVGWDSEVKDVAEDAVYTAVYSEKPVHTVTGTYDVSSKCVLVSGTSGSTILHIGIWYEGRKVVEAYAPVVDNKYSTNVNVEGIGFDTIKVWDSEVISEASASIECITSVGYDRLTKLLAIEGLTSASTIHIGVFDGTCKVLEAFATATGGKYIQSVSLDGIAPGNYAVKVWTGDAKVVCSSAFVLVESPYKLDFPEDLTVLNGDIVVNSGDLVDRGTVLSVIAKVVAGKVAIIEGEELVDGKFIMPASGVKLSVEYEDVLGFDSATYDRVTKSLTVSGSSLTGIIHIGIFSGQTKLLEAFTVTKSGKFTQDVLLDGIVPGDYIVKVWDSSAACVLEKEFKLVPSAYKVTVKYSGYSSIIEDKVIEVECGKEYSVESPVMEGYTADKLVISGTMGESEVTFEVTYAVNRYTVVFMNGETELQRTEVAYGDMPEYKGATPAKDATVQYAYTFSGWDREIVAVTGDATYSAEFDSILNRYTIVFMNGETEFQKTEVAYGDKVIVPGQVPEVPAGKVFVRWIGLTSETVVTGDMIFAAEIENGKVEENGSISYEKTEEDGSTTSAVIDSTGASTETNVKTEGKTETVTETKKDSDGNITSVVVDAVINSTVVTKQDIESVIENIKKAETENSDVKVDKTVTIQSTDSVASVTAESIKAIADAGATLEMAVGESTEVVLAPEVLQKIAGASTEKVSVSVEPVKKAMLNVKQQKVVGDSPVFELSATVGSKALHDEMKGTVVTVPYVLEGGNAADLCVWFMGDDGNIEKAKNVTYNAEDKTVTFTVDHFSKYVIGFDLVPYENGEDNTVMVLAVIAAIVVVFVAAMLLFIRRIEKQAL